MLERIEALEAAVRLIRSQLAPLLPMPEPAPLPVLDRETAQREYEAAQAEVVNQQERAAANIKAAEDNAARAQAILNAAPPEV